MKNPSFTATVLLLRSLTLAIAGQDRPLISFNLVKRLIVYHLS